MVDTIVVDAGTDVDEAVEVGAALPETPVVEEGWVDC